jgi:zona occludens toxin (predicted ATPase)
MTASLAIVLVQLKKYSKYLIWLLPLLGIFAFWILTRLKTRTTASDQASDEKAKDAVTQAIQTVANKFTEANHVAAVETVVARTNDQNLKDRLEKVAQVDDNEERLKQLIALRQEVDKS